MPKGALLVFLQIADGDTHHVFAGTAAQVQLTHRS
jgi:hypothetical protein